MITVLVGVGCPECPDNSAYEMRSIEEGALALNSTGTVKTCPKCGSVWRLDALLLTAQSVAKGTQGQLDFEREVGFIATPMWVPVKATRTEFLEIVEPRGGESEDTSE